MAYLKADKTLNWNGVKVYQYFLENHNVNNIDIPTTKRKKTVGITVHNTGAIEVSTSTTMAEQYTRATYNGAMGTVIVHFYVDDVCCWYCHDMDKVSWHSGDGTTDPNSGNNTTISIEVIGNSKKAETNAVKIIAYLMKKYKWNVEDNLFTHTYWVNRENGRTGSKDYMNTSMPSHGKYCPIYILPHWNNFKKALKTTLNEKTIETEEKTVSTKLYRIRKSWSDEKSQIGAYSSLDSAKKACKEGYCVFDNNGKEVYSLKKKENTTPVEKINVIYNAYTTKWLGAITNFNNSNDNGYAGIENVGISGFAAKSSKGTLKYRVHVCGGGWLSWISKYDISNWNSGCAGLKSRKIDAIQLSLDGVSGYEVKYRVSTIGSNQYLPWVKGTEDYAGIFKKQIDKIQIEIVKK